jgi:hypothetical protein
VAVGHLLFGPPDLRKMRLPVVIDRRRGGRRTMPSPTVIERSNGVAPSGDSATTSSSSCVGTRTPS